MMSGDAGVERLHALISGRVQGVGYRWFVQYNAANLRLTGWVRNLPDGRVELEAEGPRSSLDDLLAVLRRGPRQAMVAAIVEKWGAALNAEDGFAIR